jgi:hypothetical protein
MAGLVAHDLSCSGFPTWRLEDAPDGSPTGCSYAEVHGRVWPLGGVGAEPAGGGGVAGDGERTFRRLYRRYEEEGEAGLLDRGIGKASGKRVPVDRCEEVEALYRFCHVSRRSQRVARPESSDYAICMMPIAMRACWRK